MELLTLQTALTSAHLRDLVIARTLTTFEHEEIGPDLPVNLSPWQVVCLPEE